MAFIDFTNGEVLTADQMDTVMRQSVMKFADAAARDTALSAVLAEGMMCYLDDTDEVLKYDGASWLTIGGSIITTEGDLIVGDASGDPVRLPVGSADQVLTSDGTTVSFQDAGGGFPSYTLITSGTLSAQTLSVTSIPQDYDDLLIRFDFNDDFSLRVNGVTSSDYEFAKFSKGGAGSQVTGTSFATGISYGEILFLAYTTYINDYQRHAFISKGRNSTDSKTGYCRMQTNLNTAMTSLSSANSLTGTFELYGVTYA